MPNASLTSYVTIGGVGIQSTLTRTGSGQISHEITLPVGKAGTLTTRTDNDTGVATLSTGHGVTTGMKCDVFWSGGCRYGMDATVAGDAVTLDAGAGDNLPAEATALVVTPVVEINTDFDGDDVQLIAVHCTTRANVAFLDSGDAVLSAQELVANEAWSWAADTGAANPLTGNPVDYCYFSNGDSATAGTLKLVVLYDSEV
jgi:hypothetical protein